MGRLSLTGINVCYSAKGNRLACRFSSGRATCTGRLIVIADRSLASHFKNEMNLEAKDPHSILETSASFEEGFEGRPGIFERIRQFPIHFVSTRA